MRDNKNGGALTEVTFIILLSLYSNRHGYLIQQFVEDITDGRLIIGAGSMYGAISTLENKKWILLIKDDNRKKEYIITDIGKEIVNNEIIRISALLEIANKITKKNKS